VFWIGFSVIGGVAFYQEGFVSLIGTAFFVGSVALLVQHGRLRSHGKKTFLKSPSPSKGAALLQRSKQRRTSVPPSVGSLNGGGGNGTLQQPLTSVGAL
jgi:hypothetical protein